MVIDLTKAPDWILEQMVDWTNEFIEEENERAKG